MDDIEYVAQALAWCERPVLVGHHFDDGDKIAYWRALSDQRQRIYRYRADVAIAAYEQCIPEIGNVAAE